MRRIIEVKNDRIGLDWMEQEPRPQRFDGYIKTELKRLRADEKINNYGYEYRIKKING